MKGFGLFGNCPNSNIDIKHMFSLDIECDILLEIIC